MNDRRFNVLVSRSHSKLESICNLLPANRFNVYACPTIDIQPVPKSKLLEDVFAEICNFDYLIFTSQYAVIESFEYLKAIGINQKKLNSLRICAVGPMISQQLNSFGFTAHMIPKIFTATSLAELFPTVRPPSLRVLFPTGSRSVRVLEGVLTQKGYDVVSPIVYSTELRTTLNADAQNVIHSNKVDCIAFTSPSSVIALMAILGVDVANRIFTNTVIAVIGPSTYKACTDAGLKVDVLPAEYTVHCMARAIAHFFSATSKRPK